jgi:hypothetical protein
MVRLDQAATSVADCYGFGLTRVATLALLTLTALSE